jgi:hypothetical protein
MISRGIADRPSRFENHEAVFLNDACSYPNTTTGRRLGKRGNGEWVSLVCTAANRARRQRRVPCVFSASDEQVPEVATTRRRPHRVFDVHRSPDLITKTLAVCGASAVTMVTQVRSHLCSSTLAVCTSGTMRWGARSTL